MRGVMLWLAIASPEDGTMPLADGIAIGGSVACLQRQALADRVAAWSGHDAVATAVRVEIVHEPAVLTLRIAGLAADEVVRTFVPPPTRCADVEVAVAVALAVALDGEAVARELDAPQAPVAPTPAVPVATPPVVERRVAAPPPVRRGPAVHLAFAAGGSVGVMPRAAAELMTEVQIRWPRLALVMGVDLGGRPSMPLGPAPGRADALRFAVHAGACVPVQRGRWSLGLCAGAIAGPLAARSRRIAAPRSDVVPWVATFTRLELGVDVSPRWTLVLTHELVTAWIRPTIAARDPDDTAVQHRLPTPFAGWRGLFGARVRLGRIGPRTASGTPSAARSRSVVKRRPGADMDGAG